MFVEQPLALPKSAKNILEMEAKLKGYSIIIIINESPECSSIWPDYHYHPIRVFGVFEKSASNNSSGTKPPLYSCKVWRPWQWPLCLQKRSASHICSWQEANREVTPNSFSTPLPSLSSHLLIPAPVPTYQPSPSLPGILFSPWCSSSRPGARGQCRGFQGSRLHLQ